MFQRMHVLDGCGAYGHSFPALSILRSLIRAKAKEFEAWREVQPKFGASDLARKPAAFDVWLRLQSEFGVYLSGLHYTLHPTNMQVENCYAAMHAFSTCMIVGTSVNFVSCVFANFWAGQTKWANPGQGGEQCHIELVIELYGVAS